MGDATQQRSRAVEPLFRVKICGVTAPEDVGLVVEAAGPLAAGPGVLAIGLNFVPGSPRMVGLDAARAIREAIPSHIRSVGVFAAAEVAAIRRTAEAVGLDAIQLHGPLAGGDPADPPERCLELSPLPVIRAARLEIDGQGRGGLGAARSWLARASAGGRSPSMMLVDASVPRGTPAGRLGGSGLTVDWQALGREQPLDVPTALAGGLTPDNLERAVREVGFAGGFPIDAVDTASGVERSIGRKDVGRVRAFIEAARRALGAW